LKKWLKEINDAVRNRNASLALHIKHKDRAGASYTDRITRVHPKYLHKMYRQATSFRWFKKNKGIERRTIDQPLLSEDDKQARLQHAAFIQDLHRQGKVICYLNEKWFYIYSTRKKSKHLPCAPFEEAGANRVRI
jgi:hypothetical protein